MDNDVEYEIKSVTDFSDEEIIEILQDAIKHQANPKHVCSRFENLTHALTYELVGYGILSIPPEDYERLDSLVKSN